MTYMASASQILNSPLVTVIVGVLLSAVVTTVAAVIGLFIKVSSIAETTKSMAQDLNDIRNDKDIMRWSTWGPAHETRSERRHQ